VKAKAPKNEMTLAEVELETKKHSARRVAVRAKKDEAEVISATKEKSKLIMAIQAKANA
jgi:hypothetical protein